MNPNTNRQGFFPSQGASFGMDGLGQWNSLNPSSASQTVDLCNDGGLHSQMVPNRFLGNGQQPGLDLLNNGQPWVPHPCIPPTPPSQPPVQQDRVGAADRSSRASSRASSTGPDISGQLSGASSWSRGLATGQAMNQGVMCTPLMSGFLASLSSGAALAKHKTVITSLDDCPDFWSMAVAQLYDWKRMVVIQEREPTYDSLRSAVIPLDHRKKPSAENTRVSGVEVLTLV